VSDTRQHAQLTWIALALVTLVGLVLRFHGLHARGMWWDEASLWSEALGGPHNPLEAPLNTWLTALTLRLWGRADAFALHVPAAIFGTLTIPAAFRLGRALAGVACGLATAFLVSVAPVALFFAQEARPYALVLLLLTLLVAVALELNDAWAPRRLAWLGALTMAAAATHLIAVPFALGVGAALAAAQAWRARARDQRAPQLRRAVAVAAVVGVALAAGASWMLLRPPMQPVLAGRYTFGALALVRYVLVHLLTFASDIPPEPQPWGTRDVVAAIFAVTALAGVLVLLRRRQYARVALVLLPPGALLLELYLQLGDKSAWPWVRYATPLLIPLELLMATALTASRRAWIALPLVLALAAVNLRDGTGLPAWYDDAANDRGWQMNYSARRIAESEAQLRGVIFVQQRSIYGDETDRMSALYALPRADHLPLYWEHDRNLYRVQVKRGPGGAMVPLLVDDGPISAAPGDYAVFDGWAKLGCAGFSPHLEPSPILPPPDVTFVLCRWR
jgi:hypothetical protein